MQKRTCPAGWRTILRPLAVLQICVLSAASLPAGFAVAQEDSARNFTDIVLQIEGDPEFGEYLAGECVTCHQSSGSSEGGVPAIVGLPKEYFIEALFEYKTNVRSNEVMKLRVVNLGNDEIAALAAYFEGLEPQ